MYRYCFWLFSLNNNFYSFWSWEYFSCFVMRIFYGCENFFTAERIFLLQWDFFFFAARILSLLWQLFFRCENFFTVLRILFLLREFLYCWENSFFVVRIFLLLWEFFSSKQKNFGKSRNALVGYVDCLRSLSKIEWGLFSLRDSLKDKDEDNLEKKEVYGAQIFRAPETFLDVY